MSALHTPNSRAYVHLACGSTTIVSEGDFTAICDPFRFISGTFCVNCGTHFPLKQFVWADTNEVIADARERWAKEAPPAVRSLNSGVGCWVAFALGAAVGAGVGWSVGNGAMKAVGIGAGVGALVLPIIWLGIIAPTISKSVFGWDPRLLK
ncbi:MAG: hypothetical protein K8U57_18905 [Planctomycetes bacterium]|nr:hypothetical protein [Planctomycetota bacterium]